MSRRLRQLIQLLRDPRAVLCLAALAIGIMYWSNDLADPRAPAGERGDGMYRPAMARGDGHMHFLITRSLVFDRDFNFDNDLAKFGDPWRQPLTKTGRKNVMQQIGPSLIWAPVLAVAHAASKVANVFGADVPSHGYTMFHQRILFFSSVLFAWVALALGVLVAKRLLGGRWAGVYAGVAVLLGTSLTYYATYMPSYAHAMDAAASAGFFAYWYLTFGQMRWRRFIWLGVLLGAAAMVRVQDIAFGVVVAVELVMLLKKDARESALLVARGAVVLAIAIAMHVPQFYVWNEMYGAWFTTPQGPGQMRYSHPMVFELLFSSRNGWLSTTPLAYIGTVGLLFGVVRGPALGKHVRLVCVGLLLAIATQVYINSVTYEWWNAASFGNRRMCSVTLPLIVGLAVLLKWANANVRLARIPVISRTWARHAIVYAGFGWFVAWNLSWISELRRGAPAGRDNRPTCCRDVPRGLKWLAQPIYDTVGNPFEFPANAIFAVQHGVSLQRWDVAVGSYPLVPGVLGYQDGSYRRETNKWNLADGGGAPYLLEGWGPPQTASAPVRRQWRWTVAERAEFFLPQLMPEPHKVDMPIAANVPVGQTLEVTIYCNDKQVAKQAIGPEWTQIQFTTDERIGSNVIAIEAKVAPYQVTPNANSPLGKGTVGVAVGAMTVGLP